MTNWEVIMQEADPSNVVSGALTANTPYLFKPAATGPVLFYGEASASATADKTTDTAGWEFTGTYAKKTWDSGQTRLYGFAAADFTVDGLKIGKNEIGSFRRYNSGYCDAFRCYLWAPESVSPARGTNGTIQLPESMRVRLLGADGTLTGISDTLPLIDKGQQIMDNKAGAWYDLSARKLSGKPTKKGIYIHNGQTLIIK